MAVPYLFQPGTLLNVGANRVRFQLGNELTAAGREITLLEVWPDNAAAYENDRRVKRIVVGDVRQLDQLGLGTFDVCLWWHGPEHIDKSDLAGAVVQLEAAAESLVVMGCPHGRYPQGPFMDNPYDAHRASLYPADFEALGYQVVAIGQADDPDGGLIAWKFLREVTMDQIPHMVMVTHGNRVKYLKQTIPAVLATKHLLTLTVVANKPSAASRAYLKSIEPQLHRLIINSKNEGKPKAANAGWQVRPQAEYTVLLDDDALPLEPDWLRKLVDLADIPEIGIVGHSMEETDWPLKVVHKPNGRPRTVQVQPGNLGGACILIPRRTVELCGRYNEELPPYGESDGLYGWKVRRAGLICAYFDHTNLGRSFQHLGEGISPAQQAKKDKIRAQAQEIAARLRAEYEAGRPLNQ